MARDYDHLLDEHVQALANDVHHLRGDIESDIEGMRLQLDELQRRITLLWAAVAALSLAALLVMVGWRP